MQTDTIALDVNKTVVDRVLEEEHDELKLYEALMALKQFIGKLRGVATYESDNLRHLVPPPENALANKILGAYWAFGVPIYDRQPEGQFFGENAVHSVTEYTTKEYASAFAKSQRPEDDDTSEYRTVQELRLSRDFEPHIDVTKYYAGTGDYLNLKRAFKIVTSIDGKTVPKIPVFLEKAGWKLSRLGAIVEPGQDPRTVDKKFAAELERLSKTQMDVQQVLNPRGPEGERRVYTMGEAHRAISEARGDAREADEEAKKTIGKLQAEIDRLTGLQGQLSTLREGYGKLQTQNKEQAAKLGESRAEVAVLKRDHAVLIRERNSLSKNAKTVGDSLTAALDRKGGMFGGDNKLRKVVTDAVEILKQGTN